MNNTLSKISEARQLLVEEHEQIARQIAELRERSEKLLAAQNHLEAVEGGSESPKAANTTEPTQATGKKRGRKLAASTTAAPAAAPAQKQAKTAKTEKAEKKAAPAKTKAATSKEVERVAGGSRVPPLHERLKIVMGDDVVDIQQAIERLRSRDTSWVPESTDLKAYIALMLSTHTKDLFERVSRGKYRVRKDAAPAVTPSEKPSKKVVTAQKTNGAQNPASNGAATGIEDLGSNVLDNPFSGAAA